MKAKPTYDLHVHCEEIGSHDDDIQYRNHLDVLIDGTPFLDLAMDLSMDDYESFVTAVANMICHAARIIPPEATATLLKDIRERMAR